MHSLTNPLTIAAISDNGTLDVILLIVGVLAVIALLLFIMGRR